MKKVLNWIAVILLLLLTLIIILTGIYIADPDFKEWVNSHVPKVKVTHAPSVTTEGEYGTEPGAAASSGADTGNYGEVSLPEQSYSEPVTNDGTGVPAYMDDDITKYLAGDVDTDYVAPDISQIMIPNELLTRIGGFEPLTLDVSVVPDEEADRIEQELGYGETGDGLDFDPLMYPYYSMLDEKSKHLYRQIYANACALNDDFRAVESDVTRGQLNNAFMAVFNDHPELFWLDTKFSARYRGNGDCLELKLYFNSLANDIDTTKAQFEAAAAGISSAGGSPYETEKAIHQALANNNIYSLGAPFNQSGYSALVNGSTVCAGYSRAFQYACQLAGIPCYYCSGYAGENHAWNIICLDGDFYNVDVTWDDTDSSPAYNYQWFNKTDDDYGTTHIRRDLSVYLPPCNGTKYRNLESDPAEETPAPTGGTPTEPAPEDRPPVVIEIHI